jgi:pyruvate-formate lyase-activating enzyme
MRSKDVFVQSAPDLKGCLVERTTCDVCPRGCNLAEGTWGFCDVRAAHGGSVQDMYHSAIAAPGVKVRSWGEDPGWGFKGLRNGRIAEVYLPGCNLKCEFCVAPYLTNLGEVKEIRWIEAADLVRAAAGSVDLLGFSRGEPSIHVEYVADVFSHCQDRGIRTILETNGYMTRKTAEKLAKYTNYVGFGLKASLDAAYYKRRLGVMGTRPIQEAVKVFAESGCEVILTNLTDPNLWDDRQAFEDLSRWIAQDLGSETRLVLALLERIEIPRPWTDERVYVTPLEQREGYVQQYQKMTADAGLRRVFIQANVRKNAEERREHLEKIGLFRTLERLGISTTGRQWR